LSRYAVVPKRLDMATKSLARFDRHPDPYSPDIARLYEIAGTWLDKEFGLFLAGSLMMSYDQVIEWLRPNKSPGYPWTLKHPLKVDYYGSDDGHFYAKYWDVLATPNYIRSLCSATIKEEVRPVSKIENGDVRSIFAMDVNHVIASCQLCKDQNDALIASVEKHSIYLGVNHFQGGWHRLNNRMNCWPGRNTIELDGKKFDGRFRWRIFLIIARFRFRMLRIEYQTAQNWSRLYNLYWELAHSPIVNVDGFVFGRGAGGPSGHASTTPDNSFKNFMDFAVLWMLIMPVEYHTYEKFSEFLVKCFVGDDVNVSVHPSVQGMFNVGAIRVNMSKIDMDYHFASEGFSFMHECTFLGHGFSLVNIPSCGYAMYLPVIDCERMRTNMLVDNIHQTLANTIVRACGLRNETFACESCRKWFAGLIEYLRDQFGSNPEPDVRLAWLSYKSDAELWQLFSGLAVVDVRDTDPLP
jgi:hypothetical protein